MADLYEQLKRQALVAATKRTTRRIAAPTTTLSSAASLAPSSAAPGALASSAMVGTNSMTFLLDASAQAIRYSATPYGPYPPTWPPAGLLQNGPMDGSFNDYIIPRKDLNVGGDGNALYIVTVGGLRWDTSTLPDTALVTRAVITGVAAGGKWDMEGRSLVADWTAWTGTASDWTADTATGALSGIPLASLPASGEFQISLENVVGNVKTSAKTNLRLFITGGAPTIKTGAGIQGQSPGVNSYNSFGIRGTGRYEAVESHFEWRSYPELGPKLTVYYA